MPFNNRNRFADEKHVNAPTGDGVKVTGVVVSLKEHFGAYGPSMKMTVKVNTPDGSWLAWGTVPRALSNALKGDTVEFVANLTTGRDAYFAFAKRPRNAKLVARAQDLGPAAGPGTVYPLDSPQYEGLNPFKGGEEATDADPRVPADSLQALAAELDNPVPSTPKARNAHFAGVKAAGEYRARRRAAKKDDLTVEREHGETYSRDTFAVYKHGVYPRHSVLAGQPSRTFVDGGFATVAEALAKFPTATVVEGSTHVPVSQMVAHLPDGPDYGTSDLDSDELGW